MTQDNLGVTIKSLRAQKGLSQEELADISGLSLRTIQRIENSETTPRGDTLKRLAIALSVSPDELIDWQIQEDNNLLAVLNLSQLGFLAFPLLGLIIPLLIWILKKDSIRYVDTVGRKILNFQLTFNLFIFAIITIGAVLSGIVLNNVPFWLFISFAISTVVLYSYNVTLILINTVVWRKKKTVNYLPAIQFLN